MRFGKTTAVVTATVVAALSLTACEREGDTASGVAVSSPTGAPSTAGSPGGSGGTPGAGGAEEPGGDSQASGSSAPAPAPAPDGTCRTAGLSFSSSGGMAEGEVLINLENTGPDSCSMRGYPGLDLSGRDGTVSAERNRDRTVRTVTLAPGEGTNFSLNFPPATSGGSGTTFTSALVTPPDETHSHRMRLSVRVQVDAGSGRPVTVNPVGSGK
ncbi:DUF4232 domain-containing protein [Streptomyces sp. NPDC059166]|uniref:DUF4232 domain-containing protein n=1 Tax=Streptomyces sp. NPDC059166 TaxID=3346752 RepID=UPI00368DF57A